MSRVYAVSGREFTLNDMRIAKGDKGDRGDKGDKGDRGDKGDIGDKWGDELITLVDDATNAANSAAYNANTTNDIVTGLVGNLTNQTIDFVNDAINNTAVEGGVLADTFVTVTANGTGSVARTQRDKNADVVSVKDFGAKGDGITNDTIAFELLETNVTGREIDLQGKTYKVSQTPFKNTYVNGSFAIDGLTIKSNGSFHKALNLVPPLTSLTHDSASGLLYDWHMTGTDMAGSDSNVVQTIALDEKNRLIYAMYATSSYGGSSTLYAIPMDRGTGFKEPIWSADADRRIGHQGLAIENNANGNTYIWATKRNNTGLPQTTDPQAGTKVIRFRVDNVPNHIVSGGSDNEWGGRDGVFFEGVEDYQLWESINTTQNAQPSISYDQKWLLTKLNEGTDYRIRIFELEKLLAHGAGDCSRIYTQELRIPSAINNPRLPSAPKEAVIIQDLACDGKFIYIYAGRLFTSQNKDISLTVYDMNGNYVDSVYNSSIGIKDSTEYVGSGSNTYSEAESITIGTINGNPQILIHIATGDEGNRPNLVYSLGLKQGNFRGDKQTPALMLDNHQAGLSLAFPSKHDNTTANHVGVINGKGGEFHNISFGNGGRLVLGSSADSKLPFIAVSSTGAAEANIYGRLSHYKGGDINSPLRYTVFKSRSPNMSEYTPKALQNGDYIYELSVVGDDGTKDLKSYNVGVQCAAIIARVTGVVSTGVVPTSLLFSTSSETESKTIRYNITKDGHFEPMASNKYNIGAANNTVKNIHLANAPIIASDERLKQDFRNLKAAEKKAALEIKESICLYKMRASVEEKGVGARWHVGVKAQQIVSIIESHGLQPFDYGFICYDEWDAEPESLDDDGNIDMPAREAGNKYAIRYDELALFILAAT